MLALLYKYKLRYSTINLVMNPQAKYAPSNLLQSLPLRYLTSRKIRLARAFFPLLGLLSFAMAQTTSQVLISCQIVHPCLLLIYIYYRLLYGKTCITKEETVSKFLQTTTAMLSASSSPTCKSSMRNISYYRHRL